MSGVVGTKRGMTQIFGKNGELIPVTVVEVPPCTVVRVRTRDRDGYEAVQIGFGTKREKCIIKPVRGQAANAGRANFVGLLEFRVADSSAFQVGQEVKVDSVFAAGDKIDARGVTKGKGFQGVVRRYGFKGQSATRGTHESFRGPGSVGNRSFPGRIFRGKRMDGHMGSVARTIQNLVVVEVRAEQSLMFVRGGVPGARGDRLVLTPAVKKRIMTPGKKANA